MGVDFLCYLVNMYSLLGNYQSRGSSGLPTAGNIRSRVRVAERPREITSTFLITLNTNKRYSEVNERVLDALIPGAFSSEDKDFGELIHMMDEDVFVPPPNFDYNEMMQKYSGLHIPNDQFEWKQMLMNDFDLDVTYKNEIGGKYKRLHTHIVARFKTKVPLHIDSNNLKTFLNFLVRNIYGPENGLTGDKNNGRFIYYCNVKWLTDNAEKRRIYISKSLREDNKGESDREVEDIEKLVEDLKIQ